MKIRKDFVSNSSSSSYIIDVGKGLSHKEAANLVATNIGDGDDWLCQLFEDNIALTCIDICYHFADCEFSNDIPSGICISKYDINEYFDANGNVRSDLDKRKTIEKFSWNTVPTSENYWGENEFAVYEARAYGMMITEKSVKFTEWLIDACKELCGEKSVSFGFNEDDEKTNKTNLNEIKHSLTEGNSVYYIRTCYSGDPDCGLYVADSNEDDNGWKRLRKACKKMLWAS